MSQPRAHSIVAELVGNVFMVVAAEGDTVKPGDTILILESMKMEIPVITETGGVVRRVSVSVGDVVQEGDELAVIGPAAAGPRRP
jgi:acetyl-CoA carboxylase biotin carboxyl carrier protein